MFYNVIISVSYTHLFPIKKMFRLGMVRYLFSNKYTKNNKELLTYLFFQMSLEFSNTEMWKYLTTTTLLSIKIVYMLRCV